MEGPPGGKVTSFTGGPRDPGIQRVLIVDPSEVVRAGLSGMARSVPFVTSVATSDDPAAALRVLRDDPPDCMLLSDKFGAEDTAQLREEAAARGIRYLVMLHADVTGSPDEAFDMINGGALALATVTRDILADSLSCLRQDHAVMPVNVFRFLLNRQRPSTEAHRPQPGHLTPRERQILSLLADGQSNKQIARRLGISDHGVKRHIANMLAKLNCPNRTQAVSVATRAGWFATAPGSRHGAIA